MPDDRVCAVHASRLYRHDLDGAGNVRQSSGAIPLRSGAVVDDVIRCIGSTGMSHWYVGRINRPPDVVISLGEGIGELKVGGAVKRSSGDVHKRAARRVIEEEDIAGV